MDTMKITKKEFKELITSRESFFLGITKRMCNYEEVGNVVNNCLTTDEILEHRGAEVKGKYIVFSGGSKLDISDNEFNKYTMYKYVYGETIVLISDCEWFESYENKWYHKTLYYMLW